MLPYALTLRLPQSGPHFWGAIWYAPDDSLLLSVVQEGMSGRWLHTPPYGSASGPGAFFYPLYLALGHLCRLLHLAPVTGFHLLRLGCAAALLAALWRFVGRFFSDPNDRRFAFFLAATGGGLAWLGLLVSGKRMAELGSPEIYPFFASLVSAHLTLAIAMLLLVLDSACPAGPPRSAASAAARWGMLAAGAIVLGLTQPFGSVLAAGTVVTAAVLRRGGGRRFAGREWIVAALIIGLALPAVLHQIRTIAVDPAYAGWRTQVRTPTPPIGELLLAVGLPLPFAIVGMIQAARRRGPEDALLLGWVAWMAALLSIPYYQSRRFDLAGYVPFVVMAVRGFRSLGWRWRDDVRVMAIGANGFGSLLVLGASVSRIQGRDPEVFVREPAWRAIQALQEGAPRGAVVLASPDVSRAVLAATALRVVYAHPAETPSAEQTHRAVVAFLAGGPLPPPRLAGDIDYIFLEDSRSPARIPPEFVESFRDGPTVLYVRSGTVTPGRARARGLLPPSPIPWAGGSYEGQVESATPSAVNREIPAAHLSVVPIRAESRPSARRETGPGWAPLERRRRRSPARAASRTQF